MYGMYSPEVLSRTGQQVGTGWLPPMPDFRDFTDAVEEIKALLKKISIPSARTKAKVPESVDLRQWCSPVENQGGIGSCTAQAAVGIVEYYQRRAFGEHLEGSRLFVYKTTRNLMGVTGDTGAFLRQAMGALVLCGVPMEKYWPYSDAEAEFDQEPSAFVYAVADNFESLKYFCHDPQAQNRSGDKVLENVKKYLAAGIPSMFGFYGFDSFEETDREGRIPFPCPWERAKWGHAVVAVGYDDGKEINNPRCSRTTLGALRIRNSWGRSWGENGYGWLPYDYVTTRLARDFWSLLSMEWVDSKQFGI